MALRTWWNKLTGKREEPSGQRGFREAPDAAGQASDIARRVDTSTGRDTDDRDEPSRPGGQDKDSAGPS